MFHEEFLDAARSAPDLYPPEGLEALAHEVHEGYFARDKQGKAVEVELDAEGQLKNEASREAAARAYELIMRNKEALLDLATPLRFIFSHSALREGWDNPNVFQICNLRDMHSERERRQTIGRGLRICVDKTGQRVRDPSINTLTIVASERFGDYAEKLQQEIEAETGMAFGVVTIDLFAAITVRQPDGSITPLGATAGAEIQQHLLAQGYVDRHGKVQDTLRQALKDGTVSLPPAYAAQQAAITNLLREQAGSLEIRDKSQQRTIRRNKQVFESPEFTALWERIRPKTTYRVAFDQETLIRACVADLRDDMPAIPRTRVTFTTATLDIDQGGVRAQVREESAPYAVHTGHIPLPDVLSDLQERTGLTRRTIGRILLESGRLDDFANNPQRFIEEVAERIDRKKRHALVDGIRYQRIGAAAWFVQELFPDEELVGYLKEAVATPCRGLYEQVLVDSGTERSFAEELERNEAVKVFAKLPANFRVPTPLGDYRPDWAVLVEQEGQERLYLVVETKSSRFDDDLREHETDKIACGREHFLALTAADPSRPIHFRAKITHAAGLFA
jgi:type III restriction enzyme